MRRPAARRRVGAALLIEGLVLAACTGNELAATDAGVPDVALPDRSGDVTPAIEVVAKPPTVRVAQYNIEFFNEPKLRPVVVSQVRAAVTVISRASPDIVAVNEFQVRVPDGEGPSLQLDDPNARRLAEVLNAEGSDAEYTHSLGVAGNHAFPFVGFDAAKHDSYFASRSGKAGTVGRLGFAVVSRYPLVREDARLITDFAWSDLPGHMLTELAATEGIIVPPGYPLFSTALAILPFDVNGEVVTLIALHASSPVGHPVAPYRNRDQLVALRLLIEGALPGIDPLPAGSRFALLGDFNADPDHGDAFPDAIGALLGHALLARFDPAGAGTVGVNPQNNTVASVCPAAGGPDPSQGKQWRLDYILPSATLGVPSSGDVFFPDPAAEPEDWALACEASNHMMVWAEFQLD